MNRKFPDSTSKSQQWNDTVGIRQTDGNISSNTTLEQSNWFDLILDWHSFLDICIFGCAVNTDRRNAQEPEVFDFQLKWMGDLKTLIGCFYLGRIVSFSSSQTLDWNKKQTSVADTAYHKNVNVSITCYHALLVIAAEPLTVASSGFRCLCPTIFVVNPLYGHLLSLQCSSGIYQCPSLTFKRSVCQHLWYNVRSVKENSEESHSPLSVTAAKHQTVVGVKSNSVNVQGHI